MGMYATIDGEQVKFSGKLAEIALDNGVVAENGTATIPRSLARGILISFTISMEYGRVLTAAPNKIQGNEIYALAKDAQVLMALFNWVAFGSEEAIHFA